MGLGGMDFAGHDPILGRLDILYGAAPLGRVGAVWEVGIGRFGGGGGTEGGCGCVLFCNIRRPY